MASLSMRVQKRKDGTRCPEGFAFPAGMSHPLPMFNGNLTSRNSVKVKIGTCIKVIFGCKV